MKSHDFLSQNRKGMTQTFKFAIFGPKMPMGGTLKGYRYTSEISKISKDPGNERIGPRTKTSQNLSSELFLKKKLEDFGFFSEKKTT